MHIGSPNASSKPEKEIVADSIQHINKFLSDGEELCIVLNGDVIDSSGAPFSEEEVLRRYNEAVALFSMYRDELENNHHVSYVFSIGNHDITHKKEYLDFVKAFDPNLDENAVSSQYKKEFPDENLTMVMVNSCFGDQYQEGRIDYSKLEECLKSIPPQNNKILVMHHTIMSMDDGDKSSLKNAAKLLELIDDYKISAVFHGHIHGREILSIGNIRCKLVGVGALFSRNNPDVNSQFNIIRYHKNVFDSINNLRYIADGSGKCDRWDQKNINKKNDEYHFKGTNWAEIYVPLMNTLESVGIIYNVTLNVHTTYTEYCHDLQSAFANDKLVLGKKQFDYQILAEMWENTEVPDELYFNHGSKFTVDDRHGIEYIAEQLKQKNTSSRAVLSTSNEKYIVKSYNDEQKYMLPSLLSIQFSKDTDLKTIHVHMHLRALEAGRFLKINMWEIYYLLRKLVALGISFSDVDITISAFRVRVKKNFSCFIKSDIDRDDIKVSLYVAHKKISKIIEMLEEKKVAMETIIHSAGINALYKSIKENMALSPESYTEEILIKLENVKEQYKELDRLHSVKSVNSEAEEKCEREIIKNIDGVIACLEQLDK